MPDRRYDEPGLLRAVRAEARREQLHRDLDMLQTEQLHTDFGRLIQGIREQRAARAAEPGVDEARGAEP